MHAGVRALIDTRPFYHGGLLDIAGLLPESDAELHEWIATAVAERNENDFVFLICASAMVGRNLQANLLPASASLFPDHWRFGWVAWHMEGDVTTALLDALDGDFLITAVHAMALFVAAAWWMKQRPGEPLPPRIAAEAQDLSSYKKLNAETAACLQGLASLMAGHAGVSLGEKGKGAMLNRQSRLNADRVFKVLHGSFEALIPEKPSHEFAGNRVKRRAVARVGRNEPCPCGSGKKYKQCCYAADQERLRDSSDVAGKTKSEVAADLNADLTKRRLEQMRPAELVKLDPVRVPKELRNDYILRLGVFRKYEAVAEAFEKLGVPEDLEKTWANAFCFVLPAWRRDIAVRLLKVWPEAEKTLGPTHSGLRLLMASDDPAKFLETLNAEALAALKSANSLDLECVGSGLLMSPYRALGILVSRAALPILDMEEAVKLFDDILGVRGLLGLSPDDEFSDFMDERAERHRAGDETAPLREAQEKLGAKGAEVRQLKEKLANLQRQITLRERRELREVTAPASVLPHEREALRELRGKVGELKSLLNERGAERVTLRREVEKLHQDMDRLRASAQSNGAESGAEDDDESGEPVEVSGHQPLRLIEFPKKFAETLAAFPQHVGRIAMSSIGRIASGDRNAFVGLVKIYDCEKVVRLRLAGDYRLLLQLLPDRVQVIDLVNRKDLQRRLKTLRAGGA